MAVYPLHGRLLVVTGVSGFRSGLLMILIKYVQSRSMKPIGESLHWHSAHPIKEHLYQIISPATVNVPKL